MDIKKSKLNVTVAIAFKVLTTVMAIVVRRYLILTCGNEVNGLNSLYLSIIGFLSVAELGVGSAITFCMYKPIVMGEKDRVAALYHLIKRLYRCIGGVILLGGLMLTPFLRYFTRDYAQINVNLYITFILMLLSSVLTYLFGAKTSLTNAYKNNYITTAISSGGIIFQYVLQIIVLWLTRSFAWYLACRIVATVAQWGATEIVVRKKYADVLCTKAKVDQTTTNEVKRNVKAMFMHKIGGILVNTADSVIISAFVGVVALGAYSNYTSILDSMAGIIGLAFSSLTSVFGHLFAEKSQAVTKRYCETFHLLNYWIGAVFFLGYYAIIDNLIAILYSADLIVEKSVSVVITINGFVQFMRKNTLAFRDATGTFYYDRWKPLVEGATNIVLSILFVKRFGVVGVILATVITNLLICHIVEPYVLYKNAFHLGPGGYYARNYGLICIFFVALWSFTRCMKQCDSQWTELVVNGFISVGISLIACIVGTLFYKGAFKHFMQIFMEKEGKKNESFD